MEQAQPGMGEALEALVSPETRGDPMSPLRWTTKSLAQLTKGLDAKGFTVSKRTVARLLKQAGYRLQAVFKTKEGAGHPDRDAQFAHINTLADGFLDAGDPVISVDTKKKELVGEYANSGREWQPTGKPVEVNGHDFPTGVPKAIPYGVYDVGADDGFVTVGVDHDTAGVRGQCDPHLVGHRRPRALPGQHPVAAHRGLRRVQRQSATGVQGRVGGVRGADAACRSRCVIFRPAPASGTRSSTGCSRSSR